MIELELTIQVEDGELIPVFGSEGIPIAIVLDPEYIDPGESARGRRAIEAQLVSWNRTNRED